MLVPLGLLLYMPQLAAAQGAPVSGTATAAQGAPLSGTASAAQGAPHSGTASAAQPIDITADSGIEWQQDKQVYVARGNAVATRGSTQISADTLTAHYRPSKEKSAEGGNEVYRLDADGHVVIKGPTQTIVGDQAVYDLDQQIGIVTGKHLKLTTTTDVVTARDSLEWYDRQQVAVARGDAVAVRGDRRIRADVLTAHFVKNTTSSTGGAQAPTAPAPTPAAKPAALKAAATTSGPAAARNTPGATGLSGPDEGSLKVSRIDAQGHVVVVTTTDIARGDYGVYNAETGIVTLLGNVTITRGQDAVRGQYAVVDLKTNISRMMTLAAKPGAPPPRVEGLFYRQNTTPGQNTTATAHTAAKPRVKSGGAREPKS